IERRSGHARVIVCAVVERNARALAAEGVLRGLDQTTNELTIHGLRSPLPPGFRRGVAAFLHRPARLHAPKSPSGARQFRAYFRRKLGTHTIFPAGAGKSENKGGTRAARHSACGAGSAWE